jgi:hypothetical protein
MAGAAALDVLGRSSGSKERELWNVGVALFKILKGRN